MSLFRSLVSLSRASGALGGSVRMPMASLALQRSFATTTSPAADVPAVTSPDSSVDKASGDLYPHAPIRKFFEEQEATLKPNGMPMPIPNGRPWFASELRLKSFEDLHKLHFVLLVERNKLLNEKVRHRKENRIFPSPQRLRNVRQSMARLQTVLTERAREAQEERVEKIIASPSSTITERPPMTEAELKWEKAHAAMKKPAKHRPSPPKASGGQKTKRKMALALQYEEETKEYVGAILGERDGEQSQYVPERPRWRNLNNTAQLILRQKQFQTRDDKARRAKEQSERMKTLQQQQKTE